MGQRPLGSPVSVDDDGLAVQHPAQDLPGALVTVDADRDGTVAIGVARPDDGHRETLLPVFIHQEILTGDLVAGILPERIGQRRSFIDERTHHRLLVSRSGADIDVLRRLSAEKPPVAFHLAGNEADEIGHAVPGLAFQQGCDRCFIADVCVDDADAGGNGLVAVPPVQQGKLPFSFRRQGSRDGRTDGSCPADEQRIFHILFAKGMLVAPVSCHCR